MRRSLSQSPGRIFYGWWIVAIGCVQDAVKGGLFNTGFTLYFLPVLTELNLSRAATSLPFSLSRLEAALGAPFVGYLIDRFDVRVMLVAGTLLAGLGLILLSLTHSYLLFLLVFIGPLSFGFQAGFNQATLAVVAHWFRRKRGLAMAIVQTGQYSKEAEDWITAALIERRNRIGRTFFAGVLPLDRFRVTAN